MTTPPPPNSFFDVFLQQIQERNKRQDYFFYLENHSLSCPQCIEANEADKCAHRLYLLPPWKSLIRFARMRALIPTAHEKDFATEVYGVLAADNHFYIPKKALDACRLLPRHFRDPGLDPMGHVYVAVDPASHDKSDMAVAAMIITPVGGEKIFIGASTVSMEKCMVTECQLVITQFLESVRKHPFVKETMSIIPIIECNNNEILGRSILECFKPFQPIVVPFTRERFKTCISPGVGVWMTHTIKMAMIQTTYQALLDNALRFSGNFVTTSRAAFNPKSKPANYNEQIETMLEQLGRFRDQPDGQISGKSPAGDNDDLGVAAMMCIYWSFILRSLK